MNDPRPELWKPSADPLGEALHFLRMSGSFYCLSEFTAPWALDLPPMQDCVMFHVVTAGECRLEVPGTEVCTLRPGALALVPHGRGHVLSSTGGVKTAKLFDLPRELVSDRYEHLRHGGGGAATTMLCAAVRFEDPSAQHLVRLLPRLIAVDAWNSPELEWLQSTLRFLNTEARELRAGGETVITRLADILVIQAIRSWIATDPQAQTGWLGALRDQQIGRAIGLIHRDPARDWTVASLASAVGMSRSAFAARFTEMVGEPAMHYLSRWKMHAALTWLKESDAPLSQLASKLGYESEAAFSRAFKRLMGISPGAARRQAGVAGRDAL
jgi:AraC-like DNA-binding protein